MMGHFENGRAKAEATIQQRLSNSESVVDRSPGGVTITQRQGESFYTVRDLKGQMLSTHSSVEAAKKAIRQWGGR